MSQGAENQPSYAILCQKLHKKNSDSKFNRFFPTFNLKYQMRTSHGRNLPSGKENDPKWSYFSVL